jgi:hypothetical protein
VKKNIPMVITVANGQKMYSEARSGTDRGKMENRGGNAFQFDFRVMELGPYDMEDDRLDEK